MHPQDRQKKLIVAFFGLMVVMLAMGSFIQFRDGNYKAASIQSTMLVAILSFTIFIVRRPTKLDDPEQFRAELRKKRELIETGAFTYRGHKITNETVFVQYIVAASFGFISHKSPSRYYVLGKERTTMVRVVSTAVSAILGWWGLPFGPVFTVEALSTNISGGVRTHVRDIVSGL